MKSSRPRPRREGIGWFCVHSKKRLLSGEAFQQAFNLFVEMYRVDE